jgi:soluble lytic murein transglycosylase-like protein
MKIPGEFAIRLQCATGDVDNVNRKMNAVKNGATDTRFRTMLDEALLPENVKEYGRMERNTLQYLIQTIQRQMHDHMLRVLLENSGRPDMAHTIPADRVPPRAALVSINQHPVHKANDGFAGSAAIEATVAEASKKYGVDEKLIRAVIKAESDFNPDSTSVKGAMGLMQLMPATAEELGVTNPYDPAENVMAGTKYLKMLLDRYNGNRDLALAAYNWGMGNVERHPGKLPEETKTYIARIDGHYRNSPG